MNKELFDDIVNFTKEFSAEESVHYHLNTDIEKDIGITGDDATDYIVKFGRKYKVDLSDFDFDDHFDAEGYVFPIFERKNVNKKPITIEILMQAVAAGRLV